MEQTIKQLLQHQIEEPNRKAKLLVSFLVQKKPSYVLTHDQEEVPKEIVQKVEQAIEELSRGVPLQYIVHHQEFMKLNFWVDENVLIPQPDTEILVEKVIEIASSMEKPTILDLATGSGCIAISLANYLPDAVIMASDISEKALEVAKKNALLNNVEERITFVQANMLIDTMPVFSIIVSNPPYIQTKVISQLDKDVQKELILALDGGEDGLLYYRIIAENAKRHLTKDGYLCLEIGFDQKRAVNQLLEEKGYTNREVIKDLAQKDRVIIARRI